MEQEPADFYERVRRGYRDLAKREPNRVVLIDGSADPDEIENQIWKILSSRFSAVTGNPQSAKIARPAPVPDPKT
jgi:dTMP kinase